MSEASTICLKTWYTITPNACSVFIYILAISRISGVYSRAISKLIQLQKVSYRISEHNTVKVTSSNRSFIVKRNPLVKSYLKLGYPYQY